MKFLLKKLGSVYNMVHVFFVIVFYFLIIPFAKADNITNCQRKELNKAITVSGSKEDEDLNVFDEKSLNKIVKSTNDEKNSETYEFLEKEGLSEKKDNDSVKLHLSEKINCNSNLFEEKMKRKEFCANETSLLLSLLLPNSFVRSLLFISAKFLKSSLIKMKRVDEKLQAGIGKTRKTNHNIDSHSSEKNEFDLFSLNNFFFLFPNFVCLVLSYFSCSFSNIDSLCLKNLIKETNYRGKATFLIQMISFLHSFFLFSCIFSSFLLLYNKNYMTPVAAALYCLYEIVSSTTIMSYIVLLIANTVLFHLFSFLALKKCSLFTSVFLSNLSHQSSQSYSASTSNTCSDSVSQLLSYFVKVNFLRFNCCLSCCNSLRKIQKEEENTKNEQIKENMKNEQIKENTKNEQIKENTKNEQIKENTKNEQEEIKQKRNKEVNNKKKKNQILKELNEALKESRKGDLAEEARKESDRVNEVKQLKEIELTKQSFRKKINENTRNEVLNQNSQGKPDPENNIKYFLSKNFTKTRRSESLEEENEAFSYYYREIENNSKNLIELEEKNEFLKNQIKSLSRKLYEETQRVAQIKELLERETQKNNVFVFEVHRLTQETKRKSFAIKSLTNYIKNLKESNESLKMNYFVLQEKEKKKENEKGNEKENEKEKEKEKENEKGNEKEKEKVIEKSIFNTTSEMLLDLILKHLKIEDNNYNKKINYSDIKTNKAEIEEELFNYKSSIRNDYHVEDAKNVDYENENFDVREEIEKMKNEFNEKKKLWYFPENTIHYLKNICHFNLAKFEEKQDYLRAKMDKLEMAIYKLTGKMQELHAKRADEVRRNQNHVSNLQEALEIELESKDDLDLENEKNNLSSEAKNSYYDNEDRSDIFPLLSEFEKRKKQSHCKDNSLAYFEKDKDKNVLFDVSDYYINNYLIFPHFSSWFESLKSYLFSIAIDYDYSYHVIVKFHGNEIDHDRIPKYFSEGVNEKWRVLTTYNPLSSAVVRMPQEKNSEKFVNCKSYSDYVFSLKNYLVNVMRADPNCNASNKNTSFFNSNLLSTLEILNEYCNKSSSYNVKCNDSQIKSIFNNKLFNFHNLSSLNFEKSEQAFSNKISSEHYPLHKLNKDRVHVVGSCTRKTSHEFACTDGFGQGIRGAAPRSLKENLKNNKTLLHFQVIGLGKIAHSSYVNQRDMLAEQAVRLLKSNPTEILGFGKSSYAEVEFSLIQQDVSPNNDKKGLNFDPNIVVVIEMDIVHKLDIKSIPKQLAILISSNLKKHIAPFSSDSPESLIAYNNERQPMIDIVKDAKQIDEERVKLQGTCRRANLHTWFKTFEFGKSLDTKQQKRLQKFLAVGRILVQIELIGLGFFEEDPIRKGGYGENNVLLTAKDMYMRLRRRLRDSTKHNLKKARIVYSEVQESKNAKKENKITRSGSSRFPFAATAMSPLDHLVNSAAPFPSKLTKTYPLSKSTYPVWMICLCVIVPTFVIALTLLFTWKLKRCPCNVLL